MGWREIGAGWGGGVRRDGTKVDGMGRDMGGVVGIERDWAGARGVDLGQKGWNRE